MEILNPIKQRLEQRAALKGAMRAVDLYAASLPRDMKAQMKRDIRGQYQASKRRDHLRVIK
ncbi:MAG: hypothetical protein AAB532_02765 [Patescibacteria group bacterium]